MGRLASAPAPAQQMPLFGWMSSPVSPPGPGLPSSRAFLACPAMLALAGVLTDNRKESKTHKREKNAATQQLNGSRAMNDELPAAAWLGGCCVDWSRGWKEKTLRI